MINLKQASLSIAALTATATVSAFSPSAQAAIITGTITGTWDSAFGEFTAGDPFTVTYTYDDTSIVNSYGSFSLLSFILSSGSYTDVFNLNPYTPGTLGYGSGSVFLSDTLFGIDANYTASLPSGPTSSQTYFRGSRQRSQLSNGDPAVRDQIETYKYRFDGAAGGPFGFTDNLKFSPELGRYFLSQSTVEFSPDPTAPATAVPAPAVLPGWLLVLGLGVLGKRKAEAALKK
jgi:hypothetical protein